MGKIYTTDNADRLRALTQLLPRGVVWTREPARRLTRLLSGIADGLVRVHNDGSRLMDEADPATTDEMLSDWERAASLPDGGYVPATKAERRIALTFKLSARGGSSAGYFERLAQDFGGFVVNVYDGPWPFWFTVDAGPDVNRFRCGGRVGERLITFSAAIYRVWWHFERYKPAHTHIFWTGV